MSYSSLWGMDKNFKGELLEEFSNSWLFTPIIWNILYKKYLPNEIYNNNEKYFISSGIFDKTLKIKLNEEINNSTAQEDRILWELSNQQIFFTKDKQFISNCIKSFLELNKKFTLSLEKHISDRFNEIINEILTINEEQYPYFIFKNSSCDDDVEHWFIIYDNKIGYINRSLNELDKIVTEFVILKNNKIDKFINNLDFFKTIITS